MISWIKALLARISRGRAASIVKERLIDLSTLDPFLRAAVYTSYEALGVLVVLIALHGWLAKTEIVEALLCQVPSGVLIASTPIFVWFIR